MGVTGSEHATIYDDATNAYVSLRLISQDSEFNLQGRGEEDLNGNELWVEDQASLSLAFYDDGDIAQLKAWQKSRTLLKAIVIGVEDYIFWDQPSTILITEPHDFRARRRNIRRLVMRARGVELEVSRAMPVELFGSDGAELMGFIAKNESGDGIEAHTLLPATFGTEGSTSWTIDGQTYEMDTVIFNTLN